MATKLLLELEPDEAEYLKDIVEWWLADYDEATQELVDSPAQCFDDVTEWSDAVGRAQYNKVSAEVIRARLEMMMS
jgi:hypothetical protein